MEQKVSAAHISQLFAAENPAVKMYVGLDAGTLQGRRFNLTGPRMFNATYGPFSKFSPEEVAQVQGIADSGAFQHEPGKRWTFDRALDAQLAWESEASDKWGARYRHEAVVSYDLLIDEKWVNGVKRKQRWTVAEADAAVRETVGAAAYLDSQRARVEPRRLVMACQGVDQTQYAECARGVLAHCRPEDIFGLGGWCILGRQKSWLPTFWRSMHRVLPAVAAAGITRVHIFGVMWPKALGGLVWLADRLRLVVSTDSKKAASDCTWKGEANAKKAGRKCDTWEENVEWWRSELANLRRGERYRQPPR
jgi:hypothetical protein